MNKRGAFQGLNKVYKFTLYQLYKNKANLATFGIFIAVALFAIPVMSFFMGSGSTEGASFYTQVMTMDEFMGRDVVDTDSRYSIQYAYSILVMIVCIFAVTYIVRAILEEKSSKLVETLLVSIRSEDMILGKILAVITFIFSMVLSIIAAFVLSYFVTGMFRDTSFVGDKLADMGITSDILNIGPDVIAIALVSALLACVTLSLIADLSGAGCSSMEDMESANMTSTMVILVCYMATVIAAPFGSGPALFMSLCPFISAFAAPAYYITGDIGIGIVIASWLIQIICVFLIYKASGKIYDRLIMYKGSRMKMTRILSMAMRGKEGK